jgi:GT2 family glycosyltransferase
MKLALQIACHGNVHYLPHLFRTLAEQTFGDWRLFVLNNNCPPDKAGDLKRLVADSGLPITLLHSDTNLGYGGGHNLLFRQHDADFVQILNDDAVLAPNYIGKLLEFLEAHRGHAAAAGRIMRWDYEARREPSGGRTDVIDSLGLEVQPWGTVRDRLAGHAVDQSLLPTLPEEVFGVSGCLPLYRRAAVEQVSRDGELFSFGDTSYKEDVELAFRLRRAGWRAATVHTARAWHRRSHTDTRRPPSEDAAYYSYRNHLLTVMAHAHSGGPLWPAAAAARELGKLGWLLTKRPRTAIRALRDLWKNRGDIRRRRRHVRWLKRRGGIAAARAGHDCDVAVLMVIYDAVSADCLRSLAAAAMASRRSVKVVVVDNASTRINAAEEFWRHLPEAVVVQRDRNHGFGRSMNRAARELRAKHYFILNPDTLLTDPLIIDKLVDHAEARPDIGVLGPKVINLGGAGVQVTRRRFPKWYQPVLSRTRLGKTRRGRRYLGHFMCEDLGHADEHDVDWLQGSALLIPEACWHDLGGFDDLFFFYFEDIDLCRRAWHRGWRVTWWPGTELEHGYARASGQVRNPIVNILTVKVTRLHLTSWVKYLIKWSGTALPNRETARRLPADKPPIIAVIIPSYYGNGLYGELDRCLRSLTKASYPRDRWFIVLAEDFSPHGTNRSGFDRDWSQRVGRDLPAVHHVAAGRNLGFAGINNLAIRKVEELGCDYVYLLNQDTEVEADFLDRAAARATREPGVGIVQSLLMLGQDKRRANSVGNAFHFLGYGYSRGYRWNEEQVQRHFLDERLGNPKLSIPYASGAAALVSMDLIRQRGLFDDFFFMYHEDTDLSLGARELGWQAVVEPTSRVYHHYVFSKSVKKYFWMERNRLLLLAIYYRWPTLAVLAPAIAMNELAAIAFAAKGGWLKEKVLSQLELLRPSVWRHIMRRRRELSRTISDRELLASAECRILFQGDGDEGGWFMRRVANPLMCLTWRLSYLFVRW